MSFITTVAKQFSWLALAEAWGKVVMFILLTMIAHIGGAALGVYSYVLAIVGIFSIVSDFGTTGIYIREAKKNPPARSHLFTQFLFLKLGIIALFVAASVVWLATTHSTLEERWYVVLYGLFIIFDTLTLLCLAHLRTQERFAYEAFVKIVSKVVLLAVVGVAASVGQLNVLTVFVAYAVSGVVSLCTAGVSVLPDVLRRFIDGTYRPQWSLMKDALYQSFPLGLSTVFWQVYYRIDTVLLKKMHGDVVTGYYNAAYGILQLINVVPALAMAVLFPKMVEQFHQSPEQYRKRVKTYAVLFVGVGVVLCGITMLAAPVVPHYFGQEYRASVPLLRILACAVPILYLNHVLAHSLVVIKKTKTLTVISFVGLVVNVALNLWLMPIGGATAAAWNTVATEYTVALLSVIAVAHAHRRMQQTPYDS